MTKARSICSDHIRDTTNLAGKRVEGMKDNGKNSLRVDDVLWR